MKKSDLSALLFLLLSIPAFAQQPFLDSSFGDAGKRVYTLSGYDEVQDLLVQPDGKILVAGTSLEGDKMHLSLARYLPDGSLDVTFGLNGTNHTLLLGGIAATVFAAALQSDGKIIVLASWSGGGGQYLFRYLPNGYPDPSFPNPLQLSNMYYYDVLAVGADDKILLATSSSFTVTRLHPDGTKDLSFGTNAVVNLDPGIGGEWVFDLTAQPDGKIVACGGVAGDLVIVRLNTNGALDNSFSADGKLLIDDGDTSLYALTLKLQPDGKIITAAIGSGFVALFRVNPDGALDSSFGLGGEVTVPGFTEIYDVEMAPDGGVLFACWSDSLGKVLLKFTSTGAPDTGFGNAGVLYPALTPGFIAVQADSTIVLANTLYGDFALSSYLPTGNVAPAFNNGAIVYTNIGQSGGSVSRLALQPDGKILVGGVNLGDKLAIGRFGSLGFPDSSFHSYGDEYYYASLNGLALQSDGKVIVGGNRSVINGHVGMLYRLLPNGAIDSSFLNTVAGFPIDALVVQPDDKLLTVGIQKIIPGPTYARLFRFQADGTSDQNFGINGSVDTKPFLCQLLVLQADGKILAAGSGMAVRYLHDGTPDSTFGVNGSIQQVPAQFLEALPDGKFLLAWNTGAGFEISRYLENGSLDAGFGAAGKLLLEWVNEYVYAMELQSDGKILLAGRSYQLPTLDFFLARLLPDGAPDSTVGVGSIVYTDFDGGNDEPATIAVQPDGKIILAGSSDDKFAQARYRADLTVEAKEVYGPRFSPLEIVPNPVTNFLNIQLPETAANAPANVQVFDTQGRLALARSLTPGKALDVRELTTGIYVLKVTAGERVYAGRFVKE